MGAKRPADSQLEAEPWSGAEGSGIGVPKLGLQYMAGKKLKKSISWPGEKLGSEIKPWGYLDLGADEYVHQQADFHVLRGKEGT